MRYALIIAGGSGTRLWPMSRAALPKQLIPFIGGRSLLEIAVGRLDGLLPPERCFVCAGQTHAEAIRRALPQLGPEQFLGEPCGRDTLNAVGFSAAVLAAARPGGDHRRLHRRPHHRAGRPVPGDRQRRLRPGRTTPGGAGDVRHRAHRPGRRLRLPGTRRNVGRLGAAIAAIPREARPGTAKRYFEAGPDKFLWNSGMFVWRAGTLLECIRRYAPENYAGLMRIADAWEPPRRQAFLRRCIRRSGRSASISP